MTEPASATKHHDADHPIGKVLMETKSLTKHFDIGKGQIVHAVDDVSLAIHENEILGLVGESGSGKSTFGKTVLGLHDKTSGDVIYKGETLPQAYGTEDFRHNARRMQMIFQDPYS
ncbi:MAG TPA: ATP-binding cassette domain-containing protein, partial [Pseudomonadales bacterium]|nr:ATP-binding cassette domain-containing protein [Pseudomonadales bacterium]